MCGILVVPVAISATEQCAAGAPEYLGKAIASSVGGRRAFQTIYLDGGGCPIQD